MCFSLPGVGGPAQHMHPSGSDGQSRRARPDGWKLHSQNKCRDLPVEPGTWEMYCGNKIDDASQVARNAFLEAGGSLQGYTL